MCRTPRRAGPAAARYPRRPSNCSISSIVVRRGSLVVTDPSYAGQIVTMTCPEIGNYGVTNEDEESRGTQVAGFIVRSESPIASNWRADGSLRQYLTDNRIVAISDIDTRALTRVLRSAGVMRGVIATGQVDPAELVEKARAIPKMEGADLVKEVTCATPF